MYANDGDCNENTGKITNPWRPKDGPGPLFYRSRVLNSTGRYVSFVKALRKEEKKNATNEEAAHVALLDQQISEFCARTDRRNCIDRVAYRVKLCLESYEEDLDKKRERLRQQLTLEEEKHIRMLVEQAQAGNQLIAKQKMDRLAFLLEKRKTDEAVAPRVHNNYLTEEERKQRALDTQMTLQYQMKEKQARKSQEIEFEKMWRAVHTKHDDALGLRMEFDGVDRYRRDMECKKHSDVVIEKKKAQAKAEREKEFALGLAEKQKILEDLEQAKKAEEAAEIAKRLAVKKNSQEAMKERENAVRESAQKKAIIERCFESQKDQWRPGYEDKLACIKRKELGMFHANRILSAEREAHGSRDAELEETRRMWNNDIQKKEDERRCQYIKWGRNLAEEARSYQKKQMSDHIANVEEKRKARDEGDWSSMENAHYRRMDELQEQADSDKRKRHQQHLLKQIADEKEAKAKLIAEEANKSYGVTLPDRVPETRDPKPADCHAFSRRLRAGWLAAAAPPCQCFNK